MTAPARFPDDTRVVDGALVLSGVALTDLAERFGTPLFVYSAATLRARAGAYVDALAAAGGRVAFACKALPVPGILRVLHEAGLGADVASAGELAAALMAGVPGRDLVVHGNAKGREDLEAALDARAGLVVLDAASEAAALADLAAARGLRQDVLVRVNPDIVVETHAKIVTGDAGAKFGLDPGAAAELARALPEALRFGGFHVHLGSQVLDGAPLARAAERLAALCAHAGLEPEVLDLGGGVGVAYRPQETAPDPAAVAAALVTATGRAFGAAGLPVPTLVLEPGRSIAAQAGVTLYRVRVVKRAEGRTWVAVDGGMGDNLRVALYDAWYRPVSAERYDAAADGRYAVCGHHCESGDVLAEDVPLPAPAPGDLLAVPMTGAYHQSLSTPYNLFGRPAAVLVDRGEARLVTRRETTADLLARELV